MPKNPLHYIHNYPQRTKRLLGIDYNQFLQLLEQAELKHTERQAQVEAQKLRVNAKGGGRKPILKGGRRGLSVPVLLLTFPDKSSNPY